MKRMIDAEKFLDKLLYMGYMDDQKSEVEEVANRMTEEAYTKDEVINILKDLLMEIEGLRVNTTITQTEFSGDAPVRFYNKGIRTVTTKIQQKIDKLKENENGASNYQIIH